MQKAQTQFAAIAITIVIGALTIIAPIVWDYTKGKSELQLQLLGKSTLIEKDKGLDKLRVLYGDQEVQKLTRFSLLLVNSGRSPIVKDDLVSPPRIAFNETSKILESAVDGRSYDNLQVSLEISPTKTSASLWFPLLNPNDHIQISFLVEGDNPSFSSDARIKRIKELSFVDRRDELTTKRKTVSWLVYPVGFFTVLFLIVSFSMISDARKMCRVKRKYLLSGADIPVFTNTDDYIRFLAEDYHDVMGTTRLKAAFDLLPTKELTPEQTEKIRGELKSILERQASSVGGAIVAFVFAALGVWYIASQIL